MIDPIFQAAYASTRPIGAAFVCGACGLPPEHELHTQTTFGEYHDFDWIRKEIRALVARGNITVEENEAIACNSYERELMVPALSEEAFIKQMEYCLKNCQLYRYDRPFGSYNDAVLGMYAPELLRRFKELFEPVPEYAVDETIRRSDQIGETLDLADRISEEWESPNRTQGSRRLLHMNGELSECLDLIAESTRDRRFVAKLTSSKHPRTPDGHINNCALANGDVESNCQICGGTCPDRERYTGGLGVKS